jgi:hypothetical protein
MKKPFTTQRPAPFAPVQFQQIVTKKIRTMKTTHRQKLIAAALAGALAFTTTIAQATDPLPSWNDGPAKQSIVEFVERVTKRGSPDFVPVAERIATFDKGLDEAKAKGWTVASMKDKWKAIYPPANK